MSDGLMRDTYARVEAARSFLKLEDDASSEHLLPSITPSASFTDITSIVGEPFARLGQEPPEWTEKQSTGIAICVDAEMLSNFSTGAVVASYSASPRRGSDPKLDTLVRLRLAACFGDDTVESVTWVAIEPDEYAGAAIVRQGQPRIIALGDPAQAIPHFASGIEGRLEIFRMLSPLPYRGELADRIYDLIRLRSLEEGITATETTERSLESLIRFLEGSPLLRKPSLVLTNDGLFRAQWTSDAASHFAVTVMDDGSGRFVIFSRDPVRTTRIRRSSGIESLESLRRLIEVRGAHRWALL